MKHLNEFYDNYVNESLEAAKSHIQSKMKKHSQGFEIYIDDSGKNSSLVISVDELIKSGAEYPDIQSTIDDVIKKYKLKLDKSSNDNVVFLNESIDSLLE